MMSSLLVSEVDSQQYQKTLRVRAKKFFDWVLQSSTLSNLITTSVMMKPAEKIMHASQLSSEDLGSHSIHSILSMVCQLSCVHAQSDS